MKLRNIIVLGILAVVAALSGCRDDFDYDFSTEKLEFSNDTINLDTIFNHTKSQTYMLTVHNLQKKDVFIPRIYLSGGESSLFNLNVDGVAGHNFENIPIRSKDSIFIFVEAAAGEAPFNPFFEDEINFENNFDNQRVKLFAYIEKAQFYNTDEQEDFALGNQNWDNEYSRVIYGSVNVENLNISSGTKVYFHKDASLTVKQSANIQGSLGNEVIFRTDRMDERSDSLPRMWDKIHLKNNSASHINYAVIKGGTIGLEVENSTLNISNTKILNNEKIGLYGHGNSTHVIGKNMIINNADIAALGIEGGSYQFTQSTFGNHFNIGGGSGSQQSLIIANENNLQQADFRNSIFYGRAWDAIYLDDGISNYSFEHCVIRNDFGIHQFSPTNITDEDPEFVNPGFGKNDLRLYQKEESAIPEHGNPAYIADDSVLETDILGVPRLNSPTPGAYQLFVIPEG